MKPRTLSLLVGIAIAVTTYALAWRCTWKKRRERFLPLVGIAASLGISALVKATGTDKKLEGAISNVIGGGGSKKYQPTYSGRQWDGLDWSCPGGTVDTGLEDARACITSQFHPPIWKPDATGKWDHNCPTGTTPSVEKEWEKKCEVGHVGRVPTDSGWVCPAGTTDTGKNWNNSSWHEAQKQCKISTPYTHRALLNKKWQCPAFTKDTGKSWGDGDHGGKQCKWQQT